ncbi:FMN-binding protein [Dorea formicigenerans]|uniref:FMN-binding protein n=1 Tax=Dorea formicigenerans TaxID=39486 RepID=A0A413QNU7_9FIRM|nr:FMN-binding protein [Dorea formicigenerans]
MKNFIIRAGSLAVIVLMLFGYNEVLNVRAKDEQIAKLQASLDEDTANTGQSPNSYTDGTYEGEGTGFGGPIDVKVAIENGQMKDVEIISAENEDGTYLETAKGVISKILDAQTPEVDVMSGATFSSTGIKDAVADALQKAGN